MESEDSNFKKENYLYSASSLKSMLELLLMMVFLCCTWNAPNNFKPI